MSNLKKYLLKDIASTQTGPFGSQLHEEDYVSFGTPMVTVEHLGEIGFILKNLPMVSDVDKKRLSKYILKEGDIVFSRVGSIDRCTYVSKKEDGWMYSGRCLRVRFNEKANSKFISFYFRQKYFKEMMLNISVGATMPSLNTSLMANIPLYLPTLEIQNKIESVLSSFDSKIELNNRINAELESIARTIYEYWFVQFDFPDSNGKPYKSSGGKLVWNKELQREIPENWKVDILENHISIERGISYKGSDIQADGTPMVNLNSFYLDGRYKDDGIKYFAGTVNENKVIHSGDLMVATTDVTRNAYIIGKSFILPDIYQGNVVASCDIAKVNVGDKLDKYFLDMLFNSDNYHRYIKGFASGTLVLHLNTKGIDWYNCLIPPKYLLNKFAAFKDNIDKKKSLSLKENQQISSLRDWLLPMLMNGQVKVKDTVEETLLIAAEEKVKYHS